MTRDPLLGLLWIGWISFLILIAWQARYWINNDTIGSIDSSRAIRAGDIIGGFNALWGTGYAFLLALLPLKNISSWLGIHLLLSALLLATQAIIYPTLRQAGATPLVSTLLLFIWGSSCFMTGGTLYATADTALAFALSLLLWWANRHEPRTMTAAFTLGILHIIAGMTKSIALLGFSIIPLLIILWQWRRGAPLWSPRFRSRMTSGQAQGTAPTIRPLVAYGAAVILMLCLWFGWSMARYGRFTLSDTGAYNYAAYVAEPAAFQPALTSARLTLPANGTTQWWSDPSATMTEWDWQTTFDLPAQFNAVKNNVSQMLSIRNLLVSGTSILLFVGSGVMFGHTFATRSARFIDWLWLCALVMLALCLLTNFRPRFWPAITLITLPLCARGVARPPAMQKNRVITAGLAATTLISILASLLITHQFAPNAAHFTIRDALTAQSNIDTDTDSIGFYRAQGNMMFHGSVVARLIDGQAADIIPLPHTSSTSPQRFAATFAPDVVLFSVRAEHESPVLIDVGQLVDEAWESTAVIPYTQTAQFRWSGSSDDTLLIFTPER